ncbi:hypothetical protein [Haloferax larsenii]|nr:hypothetical protein [Haloferax larsenii]
MINRRSERACDDALAPADGRPSEGSNHMAEQRLGMGDDLEDAVAQFLSDYNSAMSEYDKGYVDADATLSVIDSHVEALREARE